MQKFGVIVVVIMIFSLNVEAQCAMCRAVLESGESQEVAKSVNSGIKYLMIFPYLLVGGLAFFIYRKYRK